MRETEYQSYLKDEIRKILPGAMVLKNDPNEVQGIPDLVVLHNGRYAMLEVKKSAKEKHQPNQDYYIDKFSKETFASFIFPENEKEILDGLQRALGT